MKEVWKKINSEALNYEVSNLGRIRHFKKMTITKPSINKSGYLKVALWNIKEKKTFSSSVHRIVAACFLRSKESKPQVNHKNGIKTDNRVTNLEWVSGKENMVHYFEELNGHEKRRLPQRKITKEAAVSIMSELFAQESTYEEIAKKHNVSRFAVWSIKNGNTWSWVDKEKSEALKKTKRYAGPSDHPPIIKIVLEEYHKCGTKKWTSIRTGFSIKVVSNIIRKYNSCARSNFKRLPGKERQNCRKL